MSSVSSNKNQSNIMNFRHSWLHRLLHRGEIYNIRGPQSQSFHRRTYELPIQALTNITTGTLGFTNQVLYQNRLDGSVRVFVPTYIDLKVKSIQSIEIGTRSAIVTAVIRLTFFTGGLPKKIIQDLKQKISIQINRGEGFYLRATEESSHIKYKQYQDFFIFLVKGSFKAQIFEHIFLSPFETLDLVLSITINSLESKDDQGKLYSVSFNNMRNPQIIPISYNEDCRFGVYDVAQNMLETYASSSASYLQLMQELQEFVQMSSQHLGSHKKLKKSSTRPKIASGSVNIVSAQRKNEPLRFVRSLQQKSQKSNKIAYFQYAHFKIPVYKMPENAWATIFIPIFMLAFLSIAIYFQSSDLGGQVAAVASLILSFIALIPSIKDQLPQSKGITFTEILIYTQALNCMLSLIDNLASSQKPSKLHQNLFFIISVTIHVSCFVIAVGLLGLHKFVWLRQYNKKQAIKIIDPIEDRKGWSNPYCDQAFLEYNLNAKPEDKILPK